MNKEKNKQIFCENIKILREKNNFSQTQMAQKLGVSLKTLRFLENGTLPPRVSVKIIYNIHNNFGIEIQDIFSPLDKN